MQEEKEPEIHIKGAPAIGGIGIGPLYFWKEEDPFVPEFPISSGDVEAEIERYRKALITSREDLKKLQEVLQKEGEQDAFSIIDAHIQMLEDPLLTVHIEEKIRELKKNTESVFQSVVLDYEARISQAHEGDARDRCADVRDLFKRVLSNLSTKSALSLNQIPFNSIIVAKELGPSAVASIQASRVSAFITHRGGTTSHTALIANEKNASYVYSIDPKDLEKAKDRFVIVDGQTGDIILNPSKDTLEKYQKLKTELTKCSLLLEEQQFPSETLDGYEVLFYANINTANELHLIKDECAGVGLFRSEMICLEKKEMCLEEELQFDIYKTILQKLENRPFVFRLLDIGGDKTLQLFEHLYKEPNPVMGCRGVRFLISHKEILRIQLRAILRASIFGNVRILVPVISDIQEFREIKEEVEKCQRDLKQQGYEIADNIPIGCMIEVPAAVLICDFLIKECDFLSIGTNDLMQYSIGFDRNNIEMADIWMPLHPSVLRMIKMVVLEAKRANKPVSICGEIAANSFFIPLFIGLGVRSFSCPPKSISALKKTVNSWGLLGAVEIAEEVLQCKTSKEILATLDQCSKTKWGHG